MKKTGLTTLGGFVSIGMLLLGMLTSAWKMPVSAQSPQRRVLYINSYHRGYKFSDDITRGIEALLKAPGMNVDLQVEYMDTKRIATEAYLEQLYQLYKVKFHDKKFDLVISSDDAALNFLFKHGDDLFPHTPVVFCGANFFDVTRLAGRELYTGVSELADIKGTLGLALQLHPATQRIIVINDTSVTGQRIHDRLMQIIPDYPNVEFTLLEDVSMAEIREKVSTLPPDSLVYFTIFFTDSVGGYYEYDVGMQQVAGASVVPVYGTWDFSLGFGIVGGKLTSGYTEGERVAQLAVRILNGERPQDIPVVQEIVSRYMFDYEQLRRWNIPEAALPEDSYILNKPFSFYETYRELVWSVGFSLVVLGVAVGILSVSVVRRRRTETVLRDRNQELQEIRTSLEQRVEERTAAYVQRATLLQAATEVSQTTTEIAELSILLPRVVELVRERFNLYYAGLFLVDEEGRWATLRAGTGAAGQQMLAQNWRLEVGGRSMIGRCVATGRADIQLDVGEAAVRFDNPFLPQTRSEMALPLRARDQVIGAMTIQSDRPAAFSDDDIRTMQTMADQIAIAISNARLFEQVQERFAAERRMYGERTGAAWRTLAQTESGLGYLSDRRRIVPAGDLWRPEMRAALRSGQMSTGEQGNTVAMPLTVRDQVVGVIDGTKPNGAVWTEEEISLFTAMIDQLNVALEGAQLYRESQRAAVREQLFSQVSGRIRQELDLEAVLKTTVDQIQEVLGLDRATIRLVRDVDQDKG